MGASLPARGLSERPLLPIGAKKQPFRYPPAPDIQAVRS
jgi:hypothetical protein